MVSTSASFSAGLGTPVQVPVLETYPPPGHSSEIIVTLTGGKKCLSWEVASAYVAPTLPLFCGILERLSSPVLA